MEMAVNQATWERAAQGANNLSELELTLGDIPVAVRDAEQSVTYADRGGDAFIRMGVRTTHANALYQAGRWAEAEARFREAEKMQIKRQPEYPLLYSVWGFHYCDFLLAAPERAAWQVICHAGLRPPEAAVAHRAALQGVSQRSAKMFEWRIPGDPLLDIALDHLTEGRRRVLRGDSGRLFTKTLPWVLTARRGRSSPGWHNALHTPQPPHPILDTFSQRREHWPRERAERLGRGMGNRRARPHETLHGRYPSLPSPPLFPRSKVSVGIPPTDLAAAEKLINDCGYHRRDEELADAKRAILGK